MDQIKSAVSKYQMIFLGKNEKCPYRSSYGDQDEGIPSRPFLYAFLGCLELFLDFLIDAGLIPSSMNCDVCGSEMKIINKKKVINDQKQWYCGKQGLTGRCNGTKSIRHSSFFTGSKLPTATIFTLIYEFFEGSTVRSINKDLGVYQHAMADWRRYVTDVLIDYIEIHTDKIGGKGFIVECDESKIGKRKYNRGHFVEGQWVFGGVERESGRCFMVAVPDRSADTLIALIKMWIKPETTVITDCWPGYDRLSKENYEHLQVNHSLHFVNPETGAHTNKIESTWRHLKHSLPEYNRQAEFGGYIAWFMFRQICQSQKVDPFLKFLEIIKGINWAEWHIVSGGAASGSTN